MIFARSISMSLALSAGRTSVPAGEGETEAGGFAAGCCAFSGKATAKIGKTRATHVRSFTFMANPLDFSSCRLQVADAPLARQSSAASGKPALWRRSVEPAPDPGGLHAALEVFSEKVE